VSGLGMVEWLRRAAAWGDRVGVLRSGLLVNVGRLSESNDPRKVVFSSNSSLGVVDVWLDDPEESMGSYVLAPMTAELEARWRLILTCRDIHWCTVPDSVLEEVVRRTCPDCPPPGIREELRE
jgi:hypothetical protein